MSDNNNPANELEVGLIPAGYQPMSQGVKKLDVPAKDEFHRRCFREDPSRIDRAQQAGYRFVSDEDVQVTNTDLGGDASRSGNSDLGSRVSVISGDNLERDGQPGRMYLMECPMHLYNMSRGLVDKRNESIADAITGGLLGAGNEGETRQDEHNRYVKGKVPDLFIPKNRRT